MRFPGLYLNDDVKILEIKKNKIQSLFNYTCMHSIVLSIFIAYHEWYILFCDDWKEPF